MNSESLRFKVFWPLVPAVAMVMIDFTIVSISASTIQADLHLSETAVQWLVTAYALSTAAFVALGGRLGDILGHKKVVVAGVIIFAASSLMCGLVPDSSGITVPWLVLFRVLQGVGGGLMIPSATVLVLDAFPGNERGKGLSVFFIVAGLFTAIGPVAGSYLTQFWTWRAIFWINVPVALLSLWEFRNARMRDVKHPSKLDVRGAVLIVVGMALTVLGIQQSTEWGWGSPATLGSIIVGVLVLAYFFVVERKTEDPLIDVNALLANRPFAVDNLLTFLVFAPWLAVFFFGSVYFQVAVHQEPTQAGYSILTMFYSFFVAARVGGAWM
ncbi:MAG TPA: MFS transporter, partial [Solirubrobacterales bacterium]